MDIYSDSAVIKVIVCLLSAFVIQECVESSTIGGAITFNTNLTLEGSPYRVSKDLVVSDNVTLTIEPGVQLHFFPGVKLQVKGFLRAHGNATDKIVLKKDPGISGNSSLHHGIRLYPYSHQRPKAGRLEIFLNGRWGTVCNSGWNIRDTQVACRQLGFAGALRYSYRWYWGSGMPIWLNDVHCFGNETNLLECSHQGNSSHHCGNWRIVWIECHGPYLSWKGLEFSTSYKPLSLRYIHISDAQNAIKGGEFLPNLYDLTISSCVYGVVSPKMRSSLTVKNSRVWENIMAGIHIQSGPVNTSIENTVVEDIQNGGGLYYSGLHSSPIDFCSVNEGNITFPVTFLAVGNSSENVSCAKTIRTAPREHLTIHYEVMTGENFELEVHDGNNVNASIVTVVNASSGVNQAVLPATSSGHEFYISFRYTGRMGTSVKFLITDDKVLSSLMLSNVTFTNNFGRGVTLSNITGHIAISNALVYKNRADGVSGMRIFGTVTTSYLHLFDNQGEGLRIENSSFLTCDFHNLFAKENSLNGFHLQDVSLKCNIENAKFDSNGYNGLEVDRGAGNIGMQNATAILNGKGGVRFVNGKASSRLVSCVLSRNKGVGCYIGNQGGSHQLSNSSINYNLQDGVVVFETNPYYWDTERHFHLTDAFSMVNCVTKSNGHYGVLIASKCYRLRESFVDVAMKIAIFDNQIQRNEMGGVWLRLCLSSRLWYEEKEKTRKILAVVSGNVFQENKRSAFLMETRHHLHIMDAVIASNHFINNSNAVFALKAGDRCLRDKKPSKPLQIKNNVFTNNRVTGNVMSVDVQECWYSEARRSVAIFNNTFEDNQLTTKDRFPSFYHRTTSRAVLVLKRGSFILHENTFENHAFSFETSTLHHDPGHVIDARFNWWGSTNECDIADRIFDYRRRAQLSLLEFFPYMVSKNKSLLMNLTILRPSCFLRNRTIGGILDRPLHLPSEDNGYEVRDDIMILTNDSLVIPGNTTLYFPSRSVMVAQGSLIVDGHETAKVKFVKKNPTKSFRLASGPGPWEGRIEFLINGTWMPMCFPHNQSSHEEASVVCQQLDLYYQRSYVKPSIKSAGGFVYNVECKSHIDADIMSCNREKWSYQTTCWENNVYVNCRQYTWAGLHLTVSKYHSTLHHLEIHDAGFAYRSDIYVPGVALRIDLNHHNISNVYINGSDGVGIQFLYQSVFQRMPMMTQSVVSHTKLHGIHTFYPLSLTDVDLMSNDIGFLFTILSYYEMRFSFTMASPGMTQTFHFCSKNKTYLEANRLFVFTLEALKDFKERNCFHILQTEPGYKLVFQDLYFPLFSFMTVYDGLNISAKLLWTVWQSSYWNVRPLFNSSRSVVLFRGRYRGYYGIRSYTNFLVSTIKESESIDNTGGGINVAQMKISNSASGGIEIQDYGLSSVSITDTTISDSQGFGIKISQGRWSLRTSSLVVDLQNCSINGSRTHGLFISNWLMPSIVTIQNSSIARNGYEGLEFNGRSLTLLASDNSYTSNKKGAITLFQSDWSRSVIKLDSNTFFDNEGTTVLVNSTSENSLIFLIVNNVFKGNRGFASVLYHSAYSSSLLYRNKVVFEKNSFSENTFAENGALVMRGYGGYDFAMEQNTFLSNVGRCVLLESPTLHSVDVSVRDNMFTQNDCNCISLVEVQPMNGDINITNNTFERNSAQSIVLLRMIRNVNISSTNAELVFSYNTLSNNLANKNSHKYDDEELCVVILFGLLSHQNVGFRYNRFNNTRFSSEICVRVQANSWRDIVNVTHNWWGTSNVSEVRNRISDFDDNYDFAIAEYWPFLLSHDDLISVSQVHHERKLHGRVLSGRLFESLTLKASQSPYHVTTDLTVLDNVSLTIEPGVKIKINPGVSILIAGRIRAIGTASKRIIFTVQVSEFSAANVENQIRLVGGPFPWYGMLQIFKENSWKPVAATRYYYLLLFRVCKHLGYGPPIAFLLRDITVNDSTPVELHCHGNETSLHECSIKQLNPPFNNISLLGVYCRGKSWGNIRFVSSRDLNVSMEPSTLKHVEFSHCGNRHGRKVYAVEAVINVPEVNFITVKNCIGGGLGVYFTKNPLRVKNSEFTMLYGSGIYFFPSGQNIEVEDTKFINNFKGISIVKSDNIPRVYYGRMFLCDEENNLVQNKTILYFEVPFMTIYPTLVTCEKVLNVHYGQGIKITLLYFKGTQRVKIYGFFAGYLILDRSSTRLSHLLHKDLFVPCDSISIHWTGHSNSQVVFKVEEIDIIDLPCTFDLGLCTWHTFSNMSVDGHNITTTWKILAEHSWPLNWGDDYSYLSPNGKRLSLTGNDHLDAHGAIISPLITKHSPFCSLVFFYQQGNDSALLSTYIQTGTYPEVKQKRIWRGKQGEKEGTWVKVQIALPADLDEYRVLLHGKVNKSLHNHSANYLSIDNLELLGCSKREHRISNSVFSGHFREAITYISKTVQSRQTSIAIERCKIVNSNVAIFIDIRDSDFTLAHNLISGNHEFAFAATLRVSQGTVSSKGLIYRNTISGNNKGIMVKQEERSKDDPVFLYILENAFENNNNYYYYYHWSQFQVGLLKLLNIPCWIKNNVFFNNSDFIVMESTFQGPFSKGQQCEMNTFYLNRGPGKFSGTCAVLSDGQMSYHRNNFKNPAFLYEFCATNATDKIQAEMNWWGVDQESEVALRIHDREDFHHLSAVIHKPFQKLPPKGILSRGCPPGWINQDSICAVLRGGSETFKEARDYCEYYGGHIASTTDPADLKIAYARIEPSSIYGSPAVPIWVTNGEASQGDVGNREQQCTVITQNGTQKIVPCNGLHPFICIRKAVNRCPNSCFHNGDCVGATCFCLRGWTGEDCSQFHCRDVHNCSRRGQCLGPNLCKCQRGYAGRGCTYSYCTKFHRCSTCSRGDSACGWCDSLEKCMPGTPKGPYSYNCPDWFYYHCYTVGSSSRCSHTIQRVDCANRQCNLAQDTSSKETCQKCHDLEHCFNHVEQGKCRAWNETQCPLGLVKVDYKDTKRIENTMIRSNVKVVNPEIATIYRCPTSPDMDDRMSVFVAPRSLGIKIGDVLSSPQAAGLMHKVNETTNTGPYTMILGLEAGIEELIQYADFTQNVSAVEITDQATVDEEPYLNDLYGLIEGNVTLNSSDLHILQSDTLVFKCVGHLYKVGDKLVPTQFLVISKDHAFVAKPEDVIISTHSHGFIEKVTKVSHVSDLMFLETELERCTENSTWVQRFKSHLSGDLHNDNVTCTGGDNSLSLITFEPDNEKHKNVSVNDVIVGRNSNPILAKVIEMKTNGNYVLIEVLPVTFIANGTAFTSVRFDQLRKEHRRQKRDIEHMKNEFHQTYTLPRWKMPLFGGSYTTVQVTIKVNADFTLSFGIQTRRDKNGDLVSRDPLFGMEIGGQIIFEADMETVIKKSVDFFKTTRPLLHSPVQLGPVFWIPIGGVGVPCAFFFTANLVSSIKAEGKVSIQSTLTVSGKTRLGGHCTFSGGCQKIQPRFDVDSNFNLGRVEAQTGCSIEVQVSPNLSLKMPTKPKWLRKAIKKVKQLWKKVFNFFGFKSKTKQKKSDWSLIQLSIETPFGMRAKLTLCSSYCAGKDELLFHAGFSEVVGKLFVGFTSKKHEIVAASWPLNWDTTKRVCLDPWCKKSKPGCSCPTTPSPTTPALTTPSTTQPPTTPPPCDCTKEEEAIIGPDESCTCLPKCKDGSKHVVVNKRYECPEYPLCGKYPNCVLGRKGPFCSQPDVPGCPYGCSGNGVIVPLSDCTAQCRCSTRWTGTCCQRRLPWRNWGDPHLETLDGIEFDYFGIGEFWGCKSIFNDFGIQFRYFAYQRASLTGGVAVKLGQSVLTIMSLKSINPQEYPKLRIDGELVNISAHTGQKMRLDNGSVIMEMQKAFSNSSEEAAVMLVSLQFESGLTLTTDVRYSHMMNRQFLNVFFTPTLAFKGYTEGLCGVMDDDQSNDLMGPNKRQYDDPIKFADSWRISTSHSNSSLRGTWSWNASNFHRDDVMDVSYRNPNFVPVYSLEGIDSFIIAKAQAVCSSLGLSNSMLKSCVYDVSVTNDTSLTAQETFQEDCPGQCSGKGRCVNSTCQCMTGWSGESCQMGDCSNCSTEHGTCIKGFCECDDGWEDDTCDKKATCHSLHNCTSPKNGVCRRTDQCRCFDGYIGIDCSMVPTCYNVSNCSARGICIDYDVCKCQKDWTGENCTQFSCASLDHCSGQGSCIALYECACYPGWTGDSCALPDCAGVNRCSGHGECVSSNTCQCYPGFQGVNCSDIADCSTLGNCNGNGVCMQDSAGNLTCRCFAGFSGLNCSTPICLSVNNCSGHGICVEADFCTCDEGYTGIDCANVSCEAINYCSGHGVCVAFDTCTCDSTWHGASCSLANCSGVNECSGKGDCILPNTCECFPGYDGVACNMTASPNLHAPIFSTPFYNLTLSENVPINTHILKVNASDADTGRNAQLFFLLDNSDGVNSAFTIDSSSGKIFTLMNFDYEGSSPKFLKLKIMVLDDGVPRKSGFAFVYITIRDENDNCPVFNSTKAKSFNISQNAPPGTLLTTVSADDIDSGLNGEVRYSVSYASINERAFAVDEKSGEVTILNGLTERSYRFVVTARDLGVPSCSRQIELTVDVFQEPQTITVTSGITTEESRTSDPVASTTNPSSDVASPTNSSSDVPMSLQPQTSKWYTKPLVIIGMSLGFVFLVVLLVILFIAQKKRQTHPKPNDKTQESRDNEALEMDTVL